MMWLQPARLRNAVLCAGTLGILCALAFAQGAPPNSEQQVMSHLNQVLRWSQQWESTDVYVSRPADELYVERPESCAAGDQAGISIGAGRRLP